MNKQSEKLPSCDRRRQARPCIDGQPILITHPIRWCELAFKVDWMKRNHQNLKQNFLQLMFPIGKFVVFVLMHSWQFNRNSTLFSPFPLNVILLKLKKKSQVPGLCCLALGWWMRTETGLEGTVECWNNVVWFVCSLACLLALTPLTIPGRQARMFANGSSLHEGL